MKNTVPSATYRVQLTKDFGLHAAAGTLPYLAELGVSTLYCSPVLQARKGSSHGYDVTDPTKVSKELGGIEGWEALCEAARDHEITLLLDIVPNHMAATTENPWWRDVLEHGRVSPYADVFDIDWMPADERPRNRVMLAVLPQPLDEALDSGYLSVGLTESGLVLQCGETGLPLNVWSYRLALAALEELPEGTVPESLLRAVHATSVVSRVSEMDLVTDCQMHYELRCEFRDRLMAHLLSPTEGTTPSEAALVDLVRRTLSELPRKQLRHILSEQCYTLEYWKTGLRKLNYRRFFDIADLAGVRVEDPDVFDLTHEELRHLSASGVVCGFRVDHIDGLRYPHRYLRRLATMRVASNDGGTQSRRPYLLVEKILSGNEALQPKWPIHGTTGYEFLNMLNGIFIDSAGLSTLERQHQRLTKSRVPRIDLVQRNKDEVCRTLFKAEFLRLARLIEPLAPAPPTATRERIALIIDSLVAITAHLPVYRTYLGHHLSMSERDNAYLRRAAVTARSHTSTPEQYLYLVMVHRVLSLDLPSTLRAPRILKYCAEVARLWQQLSGAVMAKGFEDTTLYQDSVLLSLNEVGADHERAAVSLETFHRWNASRLEHWPDSMNCTATHDTKRGEDARARLNVITELARDWHSLCSRWLSIVTHENPLVDRSTALFLLQTILGAWPESADVAGFTKRVTEYSVKVAREAKRYSNWIEPNEEYENTLARLVAETIDGSRSDVPLRADLERFRRLLAFHGAVNSISQVVLKATCPGVPDFYQGTELWDLSMVDPNNRRPVDYALRSRMVRDTGDVAGGGQSMLCSAISRWPDPETKLHVTRTLLQLRKAYHELFRRGSYEPLYASGAYRNHVCGYVRRNHKTCVAVLVPIRSIALSGEGKLPLGEVAWGDGVVGLPPGGPTTYDDAITGHTIPAKDGRLILSEVFAGFPAAVLINNR